MTVIEIKISEYKCTETLLSSEDYLFCSLKYANKEFGRTVILPLSGNCVTWDQSFTRDLGPAIDPTDAIVVEVRKGTNQQHGDLVGTVSLDLMQVVMRSKQNVWQSLESPSSNNSVSPTHKTGGAIGDLHHFATMPPRRESKSRRFGSLFKKKKTKEKTIESIATTSNNSGKLGSALGSIRRLSLKPDHSGDNSKQSDNRVHDAGRLQLSYSVVKQVKHLDGQGIDTHHRRVTSIGNASNCLGGSVASASVEGDIAKLEKLHMDSSSAPPLAREPDSTSLPEVIARHRRGSNASYHSALSVKSSLSNPKCSTDGPVSSVERLSIPLITPSIHSANGSLGGWESVPPSPSPRSAPSSNSWKDKSGQRSDQNSFKGLFTTSPANNDDVSKLVLYPELPDEQFLLEVHAQHTGCYGKDLSIRQVSSCYVVVTQEKLRWKSGNQTRNIHLEHVAKVESLPDENMISLWIQRDAGKVRNQPNASKILGSTAAIASEKHEFRLGTEASIREWDLLVRELVDMAKCIPPMKEAIRSTKVQHLARAMKLLNVDRNSRKGTQVGSDMLTLAVAEYIELVRKVGAGLVPSSEPIKDHIQLIEMLMNEFPSSILELVKARDHESRERGVEETILHTVVKETSWISMRWADPFHIELVQVFLNHEEMLLRIPDSDQNFVGHVAAKFSNLCALDHIFSFVSQQEKIMSTKSIPLPVTKGESSKENRPGQAGTEEHPETDEEYRPNGLTMEQIAAQTNQLGESVFGSLLEAAATRMDSSDIPIALSLCSRILCKLPNYQRVFYVNAFDAPTSPTYLTFEQLSKQARVETSALRAGSGLRLCEFRILCKYYSYQLVCKAMETIPSDLIQTYCREMLGVVCQRLQHNSQSVDSTGVAIVVVSNALERRETLETFFETEHEFLRSLLMTQSDVEKLREGVTSYLRKLNRLPQGSNDSSKRWFAGWNNKSVSNPPQATTQNEHDDVCEVTAKPNSSKFVQGVQWLSPTDYKWERNKVDGITS